jgi:anti-sigma B factor antagonist
MPFEHFITEKGVIVISMNDRLDARSAPDIQRQIDQIVADNNGSVLFDCGNTIYVSSAGLRVFISMSKWLKARQRKMAVCCLRESVMEVFAISGFTSIFDIFPAREEGLAKIS